MSMRSLSVRTLLVLGCLFWAWNSATFAQDEQVAPNPLQTARGAMRHGDLEGARTAFFAVVTNDPGSLEGWLGLSAAQAGLGNHLGALESARRAEELAPQEALTTLTVARLQATMGSLDKALKTLLLARNRHPNNTDVWMLTAMLQRDLGLLPEAVATLEQALESGLDGPDLSAELGLLLLSSRRNHEAAEVIREGLARHPEQGGLHVAEGFVLAVTGQNSAAIRSLERALELGEREPRVHMELARLFIEEGRPDKALEHLAVIEASRSTDPELFFRKASALNALGREEEARAALHRLQGLRDRHEDFSTDVASLEAKLQEAEELAANKKLDEALEILDSLLEAWALHAPTLAARSKILFSMNRREEALENMVEARRISPGEFEYSYWESLFLLSMKKYPEAEAALLRTIALDPDLPEPYQMLGQATANQGKLEQSAIAFQRALDLGRDTATLRLNYAEVLAELGRSAESADQREAYERLKAAEGNGSSD